MQSFALSNSSGSSVLPAIGLGTFQGDNDNSEVTRAVTEALKLGYRHIDGAAAYGNEKEIGEGIRNSGLPREEIFVTSKLSQNWHKPEDVATAVQKSLDDLQLDYVDLYLMHFPHAYRTDANHKTLRQPGGDGKKPVIDLDLSRRYTETWQAMEGLVDSGKARAIGLSNFNILKTKRILDIARIRPAANQIEIHAYLPQWDLVQFCKEKGILPMAHQPLGGKPVDVVNPNKDRNGPMEDALVIKIAAETKSTPAQVLLSWLVQRGCAAVPKSNNPERMKNNIELVDLSEEHVKAINELSSQVGEVRFLDPSGHIGFNIFDEAEDQPAP